MQKTITARTDTTPGLIINRTENTVTFGGPWEQTLNIEDHAKDVVTYALENVHSFDMSKKHLELTFRVDETDAPSYFIREIERIKNDVSRTLDDGTNVTVKTPLHSDVNLFTIFITQDVDTLTPAHIMTRGEYRERVGFLQQTRPTGKFFRSVLQDA